VQPDSAGRAIATMLSILIEFKAFTLFSFLFGVGVAIQVERCGAPLLTAAVSPCCAKHEFTLSHSATRALVVIVSIRGGLKIRLQHLRRGATLVAITRWLPALSGSPQSVRSQMLLSARSFTLKGPYAVNLEEKSK
jgi:hypothetical protein